ncbi:hypothetical protein LJC34_05465 [Oscillospiraceae bacterium OttesenSCG-928-G22]|nr:hypothetical protein [Oscillospiraceae bacterium OttesenSCG-928-G22]
MEISIAVVIAIIVGLAEALKRFGVNPKWIPAFDLAFGVIGAFLYSRISPMGVAETIFLGLVMGLTAAGLYSGVKNTAEGVRGK